MGKAIRWIIALCLTVGMIGAICIAHEGAHDPADDALFGQTTPILRVDDVQKTADWYVKVLGFHVDWTWQEPATYGQVSRGKVSLHLCHNEPADQKHVWIYINTNDVNKLFESLKDKQVKIIAPLKTQPWGMREFQIEDPNGHVLRFGQSVNEQTQ